MAGRERGGDGPDILIGSSGADTLSGGSDSDRLTGNGGADAIDGGADLDTLVESRDVSFTLTNTSLSTGSEVDTLTFATTDNLKGRFYPMVAVYLFQDADADGTVEEDMMGDDLVWLTLNHPEQAVILGAGGSGLDQSKPAKGRATLYSYSWKGGQETITELDTAEFDVVV